MGEARIRQEIEARARAKEVVAEAMKCPAVYVDNFMLTHTAAGARLTFSETGPMMGPPGASPPVFYPRGAFHMPWPMISAMGKQLQQAEEQWRKMQSAATQTVTVENDGVVVDEQVTELAN